jgi:hypothetical protein
MLFNLNLTNSIRHQVKDYASVSPSTSDLDPGVSRSMPPQPTPHPKLLPCRAISATSGPKTLERRALQYSGPRVSVYHQSSYPFSAKHQGWEVQQMGQSGALDKSIGPGAVFM